MNRFVHMNEEFLPQVPFAFKIHISATIQNYKQILQLVLPFLMDRNIAFKYIGNHEEVVKNFSYLESGSEVGKLVTVYPNEEELMDILEELYQLLPLSEPGIYILSDRSYKDSELIYYRYGAINPKYVTYVNGLPSIEYDGEIWLDYQREFFELPAWISDIQPPIQNVSNQSLSKYRVIEKLQSSGAGNIYKGIELTSNKSVVFKETRPYVLAYEKVTKKTLRENEYGIQQAFNNDENSWLPKSIAKIDEWINTYYIYEYMEGRNLFEQTDELGIHRYSPVNFSTICQPIF